MNVLRLESWGPDVYDEFVCNNPGFELITVPVCL